jgi:hypothetical protein
VNRRFLARLLLGVSLGVPLAGAAVIALDRLAPPATPAPTTTTPPATLGVTAATQPAPEALLPPPPRFNVDQVRDASVRPHLDALAQRNGAARDRARAAVGAHFDQARAGADDFARAIVGPFDSMKTIYLMGKGVVARRKYRDPRIDKVRDHVAWNYQKHVTSGPQIEAAIRFALANFEADLRANRNVALQSINRDLAAEQLPVVVVIDEEKLAERCDAEVRAAVAHLMAEGVARDQAVRSVATVVATEGLSMAAAHLVGRVVVVRLAAIPVSAAVGGTGAGATVGSAVPGLGTAIGATTGLLVGLAVDSYLSREQVSDVTRSVDGVLRTTERALFHGHAGAPGLERVFADALSTQQKAIDRIITEELDAAAAPAPQQPPAQEVK